MVSVILILSLEKDELQIKILGYENVNPLVRETFLSKEAFSVKPLSWLG